MNEAFLHIIYLLLTKDCLSLGEDQALTPRPVAEQEVYQINTNKKDQVLSRR
jgi:hypothetical protein